MAEAIQLTAAHWVYAVFVILIFVSLVVIHMITPLD